jgi:hypothetical protein
MMLKASIPVEHGNAAANNGTLGSTIQKILEDLKPEAAYFVAENGQRTALIFFDMQDTSQVTAVAEPWFLAFHASVTLVPVMTPQDLAEGAAGIERAVKNFGKAVGA